MRLYTIITICYMLLIIYFSHLPQDDISEIVSGPDNIDFLFHFFEYLILGFLLFLSLSTDNFFTINPVYGAILVGISFAVSDEFHQYFVPGRHMSIIDIISDSIGLISGIFVSSRISKDVIPNS